MELIEAIDVLRRENAIFLQNINAQVSINKPLHEAISVAIDFLTGKKINNYNSFDSRDYEKLFKRIEKGEFVAVYVNYLLGGTVLSRDLAAVKKYDDGCICIGVRGIEYANIRKFNMGNKSQLDMFIEKCKYLDLSF